MAFTSLIPINSTSGTQSAPRAIAAGAFERVGLKYPGGDHIPAGCEMRVLVPDDTGDYKTTLVMDTGNITEVLGPGPLTYKLEVVKGVAGAYAEHA